LGGAEGTRIHGIFGLFQQHATFHVVAEAAHGFFKCALLQSGRAVEGLGKDEFANFPWLTTICGKGE